MPLYGTFDEFTFAEVLQLLNLGHKSGTLTMRQGGQQAVVHVRDGQVIEATHEGGAGAQVIYRLLGWRDGEFEFTRNLRPVTRAIQESTEALIMEGMRRLDEWQQIEREFSDLNVVLRLRSGQAAERYDGLADDARCILRLVDARRNVAQIIRESGIEPVQAILVITELISQDLVEKWGSAPVSTRDQVAHVEPKPPTAGLGLGSYFSAATPKPAGPARIPESSHTGADPS